MPWSPLGRPEAQRQLESLDWEGGLGRLGDQGVDVSGGLRPRGGYTIVWVLLCWMTRNMTASLAFGAALIQ